MHRVTRPRFNRQNASSATNVCGNARKERCSSLDHAMKIFDILFLILFAISTLCLAGILTENVLTALPAPSSSGEVLAKSQTIKPEPPDKVVPETASKVDDFKRFGIIPHEAAYWKTLPE